VHCLSLRPDLHSDLHSDLQPGEAADSLQAQMQRTPEINGYTIEDGKKQEC